MSSHAEKRGGQVSILEGWFDRVSTPNSSVGSSQRVFWPGKRVDGYFRAAGFGMAALAGPSESFDSGSFTVGPRLACAWDGRLDNGHELAREMGESRGAEDSAAKLATRLFERFGWTALSKLMGDWSLALWDACRRTLVLARDYAGVRPLFYAIQGGEIRWSSSLDRLAGAQDIELEDSYLIQFAAQGFSREYTPYRNTFRVPPGCALIANAGRIEIRQLWTFCLGDEIRRSNVEDYAEEMTALFRDAVRRRLASDGCTTLELSGGLDSSSVVCAANAEISGGDRENKLATVSYDEADSIDGPYIQNVEEHCRIPSIHVPIEKHGFVDSQGVGNTEPLWWQPRWEEVRSQMLALGSSVLLTGRMGDFTMGNWIDDSEQVADRIAKRQYREMLREAVKWSQFLKQPIYSVLWRAGKWACRRRPPAPNGENTSLLPAARREAGAAVAGNSATAELRKALPSRRKKLLMLQQLIDSQTLECPEPLRAVSVSHPFADRALVEFMLRIPAPVVCGPGEPRMLMRRSFHSFLPRKVISRRSKATYAHAFHRVLIPMAETLLSGLSRATLVQRGILDPNSLRKRLLLFTQGLECNESQLRNLILLEFWVRRFEQRQLDFQCAAQPDRLPEKELSPSVSGALVPCSCS
jgi:asparagine synthase (glutamine-hydrolysing)